jgi:putative heme-binding domain-containing protein
MKRRLTKIVLIGLLLPLAILPAQAQRRGAPAGPLNPFAGNSQAIAQGEQVYNQNCTSCHGPNGGAGEIGPEIIHNLSVPLRGELNDNQILDVIRNGAPGTAMPAWQGKLADDDILKMGAFLQSLRGTAIDNPLPGNVAHGDEIFWNKGQCGTCHMLGGRGGLRGPDLTNIAAERKSNLIVDALTKPNHRVYGDGGVHLRALPTMDTYDAVHITLSNGRTVDGVLLNQDSYSLQLMGDDNELHLLDRSEVKAVANKPPLMPTDYDKRLTKDEFADLMAFLTRQGRKPPPAAAAAPRNADPD